MLDAPFEDEVHISITDWLAVVLCPPAIFHHSPNEGMRHVRFRRKLARMGSRAGWPDIEIMFDARAHFMEVKRPKPNKTYPSVEQKAVHHALRAAGCKVAVVRSIADAEKALRCWGIPIRARD